MTFEARLAACGKRIEAVLEAKLERSLRSAPERLAAAMRHAVLGGGKRFRPFLVLETANLLGASSEAALEAGAAVELIHCYSLVHDDLPAMDDDAMRRGRPTCHVAFGEATAILAGDALQSLAFEIIASSEVISDPAIKLELVRLLAVASGAGGMAGGQQLDLEAEAGGEQTLSSIARIQAMKTGALIGFSVEAGAVLAGTAADDRLRMARFAELLGLAFQISDDLLDAEGDAAAAGKAVGKDAAAGKATFVSMLGIAGAREELTGLEREARVLLSAFGPRASVLGEALRFVVSRRS
ncbi:MAG: polyprenyl synthetase family protein [Rhizobiales bacterium]|nr:polyprenyl synthetase family protein [Hyphomicrobiales bacterium]